MDIANEYVYMFKKNRRLGVIEKNAIMYISCHGRVLHVGTPYIVVEHNGTLHNARQLLGEDDFIQVNKSDLINIKYVIYTDLSTVTMRDGTVFPVTPAYSAQFSSKLLNLYINKDHLSENI